MGSRGGEGGEQDPQCIGARLVRLTGGVGRGGYVLVLTKARAFFEKPAVRRVMDRITGVVLTGSGVEVVTSQP